MSPGEKSQEPADPHFLLEQATFLWGESLLRLEVLIRPKNSHVLVYVIY